jgi:hypothetical protein
MITAIILLMVRVFVLAGDALAGTAGVFIRK